jgi:ligand-binding sensor domain-containing protein
VAESVHSILEDKQGHLWFATNGGISRFDGTAFTNYTSQNSGLGANYTRQLFEDSRGHIWAMTLQGASRFDGEIWAHFTARDGLASDQITAIMEDRNSKWV